MIPINSLYLKNGFMLGGEEEEDAYLSLNRYEF